MTTDHPVVESLKATVGFTRKVQMENRGGEKFESAEYSAFVPVEIDPDIIALYAENPAAARTQLADLMREAWLVAKGSVFEQAGLPFKYDADGAVLVEIIEGAFPGTKAENGEAPKAQRSSSSSSSTRRSGSQGRVGQKSSGGKSSGGSKGKLEGEAAWRDLVENTDGWFDNRDNKKSESSPDFKRKGTGEALWLYERGTDDFACPDFVVEHFGLDEF